MNAKSYLDARNLRDIFSQLGWGTWQITALGADQEGRVIIQYRSDALGQIRQVMADPYRLAAWMRERATRPVWLLAELAKILDRKPERPAPPQQGSLFPAEDMPRVVRASMTPNEP